MAMQGGFLDKAGMRSAPLKERVICDFLIFDALNLLNHVGWVRMVYIV